MAESTESGDGRFGRNAYRAGIAIATGAVFLLSWLSLGVGINGPDGEPFDRIYIGVLAVGLIGAVIARFQPNGMARTLFAMALAQTLVMAIALIVGKHQTGVSPLAEIMGLNAIFVGCFSHRPGCFGRQRAAPGPDGERGNGGSGEAKGCSRVAGDRAH